MTFHPAGRGRTIPLYLLTVLVAGDGNAAGTVCADSRTSAERLVCGSQTLRRLDFLVESAYREASRIETNQEIVQSQEQWLRKSRDRCKGAKCMIRAYRQRLVELDNWKNVGMANDWLVIPGERMGPISMFTIREDLVRLMGEWNVSSRPMSDLSGPQSATVLYAGTAGELTIMWNSGSAASPKSLWLSGANSNWRFAHDLRINMPVQALEKLNGRSFSVKRPSQSGHYFVDSWKQGLLQDALALQRISVKLERPGGLTSVARIQDARGPEDSSAEELRDYRVSEITIRLGEMVEDALRMEFNLPDHSLTLRKAVDANPYRTGRIH